MWRVGALCGSLSKQAHTKTKKACKDKALTSIRSWDDSSSEEEDHHKRRGRKHSSSRSFRVCLMARDTCTQEVAMENEQLKQEVAHLTKDLTQVQGKMEQAQLHQDNTIKGVKKLDEGQIMFYYVCHKYYECKVKNGGGAKKREKTKRK